MDKIENQTLLFGAANGDVQAVIKALSDGADINIKDANGYTPLHCAVYNNHLLVVQILVEAKADVNCRDTKTYDNWTPLHFASYFSRMDMVKALLKSHQDVHVLNGKYQTPADLAQNSEIKELLLQDTRDRNIEQVSQIKETETAQLLQNQPQQQPQLNEEPQQITESVQQNGNQCCYRSKCGKGKMCCKVTKAILIGLMVFFPFLYLLTNPYAYPWFIWPCGVIAGIFGLWKVSANKEKLMEKGVYNLKIHAVFYLTINIVFLISNIWTRSYFWAFHSITIWGSLFLLHVLKTKKKDSHFNKGTHIHLMFYLTFTVNVLVSYLYITCNGYSCYRLAFWPFVFFFLPVSAWGIGIIAHIVIQRKKERQLRDLENQTNQVPTEFQQPQQQVVQDFQQPQQPQQQQQQVYQQQYQQQYIQQTDVPVQQPKFYPNI